MNLQGLLVIDVGLVKGENAEFSLNATLNSGCQSFLIRTFLLIQTLPKGEELNWLGIYTLKEG